jgi:hypothetical protein
MSFDERPPPVAGWRPERWSWGEAALRLDAPVDVVVEPTQKSLAVGRRGLAPLDAPPLCAPWFDWRAPSPLAAEQPDRTGAAASAHERAAHGPYQAAEGGRSACRSA